MHRGEKPTKKTTPKKGVAKKKIAAKKPKPAVVKTTKVKKVSTKNALDKKEAVPVSKKVVAKQKPAVKKVAAQKAAKEPEDFIESPYQAQTSATQSKPKLFVRARHIATKSATVSLFQFDGDEVAILIARYGGIACIIIGGLFTLHHSLSDTSPAAQAPVIENTASVSCAEGACSTTYAPSDIEIELQAQPPLQAEVNIIVSAPESSAAQHVLLYAQNEDTGQPFKIGFATNTVGRTWEYIWDTSRVTVGNYTIEAQLLEANKVVLKRSERMYEVTAPGAETATQETEPDELEVETAESESDPEASIPADEIPANEVISETSPKKTTNDVADAVAEESVPEAVAVVSLNVPAGVLTLLPVPSKSSLVEFGLESLGTKWVEIYIQNTQSAHRQFLSRAYKATDDTFVYVLDKSTLPSGTYAISAVMRTETDETETNTLEINVNNPFAFSTPAASTTASMQVVLQNEKDIADALTPFAISDSKALKGIVVPDAPRTPSLSSFSESLILYQTDLWPNLETLMASTRSSNNTYFTTLIAKVFDAEQTFTASANSEDILTIKRLTAAMILQAERTASLTNAQLKEKAFEDTDNDLLADIDERTLFDTDPSSADTDNDGFLDGAEIFAGFNPLVARKEAFLSYQSPATARAASQVYTVEGILPLPVDNNDLRQVASALMYGKAAADSFIRVYVYSSPEIFVVPTNEQGLWSLVFDRALEEGEHTVFAGAVDNLGALVALSNSFSFSYTDNTFTPAVIQSVQGVPMQRQSQNTAMRDLFLVSSLCVVAIGLLLLLIGHHLYYTRLKVTAAT